MFVMFIYKKRSIYYKSTYPFTCIIIRGID